MKRGGRRLATGEAGGRGELVAAYAARPCRAELRA
jgi:hypothetical protein